MNGSACVRFVLVPPHANPVGRNNTVFPQTTGMAATGNLSLISEMGQVGGHVDVCVGLVVVRVTSVCLCFGMCCKFPHLLYARDCAIVIGD